MQADKEFGWESTEAWLSRQKHSQQQHQLATGLGIKFWKALTFAIFVFIPGSKRLFSLAIFCKYTLCKSDYSLGQMEDQVWTCKNIVSLFFLITTKALSPEKCYWKSACWNPSVPHTAFRSVVETSPSLLGPWSSEAYWESLSPSGLELEVLPWNQAQPWA